MTQEVIGSPSWSKPPAFPRPLGGGFRGVQGGWFQSYLRKCHPETSHVWIRTYPSKSPLTPHCTAWLAGLPGVRPALFFPRGRLIACAGCFATGCTGLLRRNHPPAIQQFASDLSDAVRQRTVLRTNCMGHTARSCDISRMETASLLPTCRPAESSSADRASVASRRDGGPAPKRDRRQTLTKIDKRLPLGKRIAELTSMFTAAVGGEPTPVRRLAVDKAAQLTAIAEQARGAFMRDATGTLDDIVRLERKADQAVRALGIREAKPKGEKSPLAAHFSRPVQRSAAL
jgi:hypothetical protein